MSRNLLKSLAPDLLLGVGILASTWVALWTAGSGWLVMAGPLVLALSVALAGVLASRRHGARRGELRSTAILALIMIVAGAILIARNPTEIASMMPVLGAAAAMPIILRRRPRDADCPQRPFLS